MVTFRPGIVGRILDRLLCRLCFGRARRAIIFSGWWLLGALLLALPVQSQSADLMTLFSHMEYGAHPQNQAIVQGNDGTIYIGNQAGLLVYSPRGSDTWRLLTTPYLSPVYSLDIDSRGRIYLGGKNEFGYLQKAGNGDLTFIPLQDSLPPEERTFGRVVQTRVSAQGVYFQTENRLFRWQRDKLRSWQAESKFDNSFVVYGRYYVRQWGIGLMQMASDSLVMAHDGARYAQEPILLMLPYDNTRKLRAESGSGTARVSFDAREEILVGTRRLGIIRYIGTQRSEFNADLNRFLTENELVSGAINDRGTKDVNDDRFVLTTRYGGVIVINRRGEIRQQLNQMRGLPSDYFHFAYPDRNGNLWLAYQEGLCRIDREAIAWDTTKSVGLSVGSLSEPGEIQYDAETGLPFIRNFNRKSYNVHGQNLTAIQDSRGIMFIANNEGILEFDGVSWRLLELGDQLKPLSLAIDSNDRIYVGAAGDFGYLDVPPNDGGQLQFHSLRDRLPASVQNIGAVRDTRAAPEGIYFITESNIFLLSAGDDDNTQLTVWQPEGTHFAASFMIDGVLHVQDYRIGLKKMVGGTLQLLPQGRRFAFAPVQFILPDGAGQLLIGTARQGIFRCSQENVEPYPTRADPLLWEHELVHGVMFNETHLAIATRSGGIALLGADRQLQHIINKTTGLQDDHVNRLFLDRDNGLWATLHSGISRLEIGAAGTFFDERLGLKGSVQAITRYQDRLYVGTIQGAYYLDVNPVAYWKTVFKPVSGISDFCRAFLVTDNGLLAATEGGVFHIVADRAEKVTDYDSFALQQDPFDPNNVYVAQENDLATVYYSRGVWKEGSPRLLIDPTTGSRIAAFIRSIAVDSQNNMWLGTQASGVIQCDLSPDSMAVQHFTADEGLTGGVRVFNLGDAVIFANAEMLYNYDAEQSRFVPANFSKTFDITAPLDEIALERDHNGATWLNLGPGTLTMIPSQSQVTRTFPRYADMNFRAIFPDTSDVVWLGGSEGMVRLQSRQLTDQQMRFPAFIREVQINDEHIVYGGAKLSERADMELPYARNNLHFEFAAPTYNVNSQVLYQYYLQGFDKDWSEWTPETRKDYTNLPEGNYRFLVRARNIYGVTSQEDYYGFSILPPWYRTWWAYVLFTLFIGGVGFMTVRYFSLRAQQKAEEQLRQERLLNERLRKADRLKDEFLANTSHELRTPLNGIIGLAESLMDGVAGKLSPEAMKNLRMIVFSGRRLFNLVNDLLDFSKLKNNEIVLQLKPLSLRAIVEVVLMLSKPLVGQKNVALVNDVAKGLPPVYGDENRLQQILLNLVGNAIKFTENGQVIISAVNRETHLEVQITDTGIGIPPDKFDDIFKSFEQVDASIARRHGGSGLGLAITKQLVTLHNGKIWLESEVEKGSTFYFTLPISREAAQITDDTFMPAQKYDENFEQISRIQDETSAISEAGASSSLQSDEVNYEFRILAVDDEPINLQVVSNMLSLQHFSITCAASGQEALDILAENPAFDLVLLDVMMPQMSGYEVCTRIRERFSANILPVILLTAKNQVSDLVVGFEAGANDYITKPISKNELLSRIKTHVRLAKINAASNRFVPKEFLQFLEKESLVDVQLGDQIEKEMTVLFSDIRAFTTMSEQMTPEDNFRFINAYLSRMEPIIARHHGFIDKYIGDAIMALFGKSTDDAVNASIAMLETLNEYNKSRQRPNRPAIKIGIGVHTGKLMLGTVGGHSRMDGTVISDAVNLASRLEGLTKKYHVSLLISDDVHQRLTNPENYSIRRIERVMAKGKTNATTIYEVFDADPPELQKCKRATRQQFEAGVSELQAGNFEEAVKLFEQCLTSCPDDTAAQALYGHCNSYLRMQERDVLEDLRVLERKS